LYVYVARAIGAYTLASNVGAIVQYCLSNHGYCQAMPGIF